MTCVQIALVCNITSDGLGGDTNGRGKVAFRPKTVYTPVVLPEDGKLVLDIACSVGF